MWGVDYSMIESWLDLQDTETVAHIFAALEVLQREGPSLGRPLVDTLVGTRIKNLKELRPASTGDSEVRILFAFDSKRSAIMLIAGDKSCGRSSKRKWSGWYKRAIPAAEQRFEAHLRNMETSDVRPE